MTENSNDAGIDGAPSLEALRSELSALALRRQARERDRGVLGPGACNVAGGDFTIEGEILRQTVAAEQARVVELEAAIAALEAELPNSPQKLDRIRETWERRKQLEQAAS